MSHSGTSSRRPTVNAAKIHDCEDKMIEHLSSFIKGHITIKDADTGEILVDKDNNLVSLDDVVYTPISKDYDLNIPDFVNIKFITIRQGHAF